MNRLYLNFGTIEVGEVIDVEVGHLALALNVEG